MSINTAGTITGMYRDASLVYHGFVRTASGAINTFSAPGAGAGIFQGTEPMSINSAAIITGFYRDANYVSHGFVRAANGTISTFNVPGAGTNPGQAKGISVTFKPTATGARAATLAVADSANNSPQKVSVKGTGE